ncbi:MAG: hypothetical protein VKO39_03990 [Cyanobacteriota bacterium]|nr:hypothetical protein [Cyanobacteriota bacterium]
MVEGAGIEPTPFTFCKNDRFIAIDDFHKAFGFYFSAAALFFS